jgi:outer membrane immunogenic protein
MKIYPLMTAAAVASLALVASSAFAETSYRNTRENVSNSPFTGPYLGVYGGYDWSEAESDTPGFEPEIDGWEAGVFGGFRVDGLLDRIDGVGIGMNGAVEAFYGMSNSDANIGGVDVEKGNEWGVSFRPGFSFTDRLASPLGIAPYAILGYRNTEFEAFAGGAGASERYDGFELGIGTELLAYGDLGVRAEYSHVWYASENGIDPDSDSVRLGLSYHF